MKKTKKIGLIAIGILIIAGIIAILSTKFVKKVDNIANITDPEILRSMTYTQVTDEDSKVDNCEYVKFNAFFTRDLNNDGNAEMLLGTCREINDTDTLYMDINVLTDGYLENGVIEIHGSNFNYSMNMIKDNVLKYNYLSDNVKTIQLNQINAGTQKLIIGNVLANIGDNINNYSNVSSITLKGTHVSDDGQTRTDINKTIDVTVDWHGKTSTSIYASGIYYNIEEFESDTISFNFSVYENSKDLLLQENFSTLAIPNLNGYAPLEVTCTNSNVEFNYDAQTQKFTIKRTSTIKENGEINSKLSTYNSYNIVVKYPQEAYDQISSYTELKIPIETYYTGYNNPNEEFQNPYKSNIAKKTISVIFREKPKGSIYNFYVYINDKIYVSRPNYRYVITKQDILNAFDSEEPVENKKYTVEWFATRGSEGEVESLIMSETKQSENQYGDKIDNTIIDNYTVNTGIYFSNPANMLGENGTISIYNDETNELIKTFTKEDWRKYTKQKPFTYEEAIKHIRVETSAANVSSNLSVYHVKELNIEKLKTDYTKEQVEEMQLIKTHLTGICNIVGQNAGKVDDIDSAYLVSETSNAEISLSNTKFSTQETYNNQLIYIDAKVNQIGDAKWQNGIFIVELPEEIIKTEINSITTNNNNVEIIAYDIQKQNNKNIIKIITKNENLETFSIIINTNITADPRIPNTNSQIKLYAYNEYCNNYYFKNKDIYDVNANNNAEDYVGIDTINIDLLSPTGIVTMETITNYNSHIEEEITIAPNVAEVKREENEATINVIVGNNYPNSISEVKVLGKIPFEGNKYVLNGENLDSKFTATMTDKGIQVPTELKDIITVYYSENENPTKDITNSENGWKTIDNVDDFNKIKTYLIDFNDYKLKMSEKIEFNYNVSLTNNNNLNLISYSNHAIYYQLDTEGGKLELETEPNKVGLKVTRNFDLDLTKVKSGVETLKVPGAIYKLEYTDTEENIVTRILTTDTEGKIKLEDLFVGFKYTLSEIVSPINYELNTEILEIQVLEDEQGNLKLETNNTQIVKLDNEIDTVIVNAQDEAKYNITFTKLDENTLNPIANVRFRINGKIYITDINGQIKLDKLSLNKEYVVVEEAAQGYYVLNDSITFKLIKNENGELILESNNQHFKNCNIENTDKTDFIQVSNISLTNKKIPTYNLEVIKVEENIKESDISKLKRLQGAKFQLQYYDLNIVRQYTTGENGSVIIPDLYQYIDGKDITGKYVLQEIEAPDGYSNDLEMIEFKVKNSANGSLQVEIENRESLNTIKDVQIDGNTLKIMISDVPLFELVKTDAETKETLANVKFVIYELDDNLEQIDFAKDVNGNYVGELNEKNQYVLTTDELGKIVLPLKNGKYKAVEIENLEKYDLRNAIEYFEIQDGKISRENIIEINSIEDLVYLSRDVNNGNTYSNDIVVLTRTLDFMEDSSYDNPNDTTLGDLNKDGIIEGIKLELTDKVDGIGFTPIGKNNTRYFSGQFDGNNNEIRNLYINNDEAENIGLFGYTKDAMIKDIGVTGKVIGGKYLGGIIGYGMSTSIRNCYNKAEVSGYSQTGGILGYAQGGYIFFCYNEGEISGNIVGGISGGTVYTTYLEKCYNKGIINCINNKTETYNNIAGGIVGTCDYGSSVESCYSISDIKSKNSAFHNKLGGIIGRLSEATVKNSYFIGNIYGNNNSNSSAGRIIGNSTKDNRYVYTECYYNSNVVINSYYKNSIGTSYSDINMKTESFVTLLGTEWQMDTKIVNNGYPIFRIHKEDTKLYSINYIEDLVDFSRSVNNGAWYRGKIVKLERTIDFMEDSSYRNPLDTSYGDLNNDGIVQGIKNELTDKNGCGFTSIGNERDYFTGVFDGQGNKIKKIYINSNNRDIGLFGYVKNAEIKNVSISGEIINTEPNFSAGGIVGDSVNSSLVNLNNSAKITVSSNGTAGGIAGSVTNNRISNCYNTGDIIGDYVGGISGGGYGTVFNNCYNMGNITGGRAGGIASQTNQASWTLEINNCYNLGTISGTYAGGFIADCYHAKINNCYNAGDVIGKYNGGTFSGHKYTENVSNTYYLETIKLEGENINKSGEPVSESYMLSEEFYNKLNVDDVWVYNKNMYPTLNMKLLASLDSKNEVITLNVENVLKEFTITTEILENSIGERAGGTISGEYNDSYLEKDNIKYIETVKYGNGNQNIIEINAKKDYTLSEIIINGQNIEYEINENGNVTIPAGYFEDVKENKHIAVVFEPKDNLIITKVDENDNSIKLEGAKFKIEQESSIDTNGLIGEIQQGSNSSTTHHFSKVGTTYQSTNTGVSNSVCTSYFPIDLTNYSGKTFTLNINASISSESVSYDYGYARITTSSTVPAYTDTTGQIFKIGGTSTSTKTYTKTLQGGQKYYLHIGYRKDSSVNSGSDKFTINNINLTIKDTIIILVDEVETNSEGIASLRVENNKKYIITEIEAPKDYELNIQSQEVTIAPEEIKNITITNKEIEKAGNLKITKVDADDNNIKLQGVEFEVKRKPKDIAGALGTLTDNGTYVFKENNGIYTPNNKGINSSIAKSYFKIDLTGKTGKYNLIVNAQVSSENNCDVGYAAVTESSTAPAFNRNTEVTGQFIKTSGTSNIATDYSYTDLEGGKVYYLHISYIKDGSVHSGNDSFTVNSMRIEEVIESTIVTTNSEGIAQISLHPEEYLIKELKAPEGYILNEEIQTIVVASGNNEITINNSLKKFNITTKVEKTPTQQVDGGTISGKDEQPYEEVKYKKTSIKDILINPDDGYKIISIKINGEQIQFTPDDDGNVLLDKFVNMQEDKDVIVRFVPIYEPNFTLKKTDEVTNEPLEGIQFAIYYLSVGNDFAKDKNGLYIGEQDENGMYLVTTDENGEIKLSLPSGEYKAVEIKGKDGYVLDEKEEDRTTYFKVAYNADLEINYIEDLIDLSNNVTNGNTYEGKIISLTKNLDFNDVNSYRNANDITTYGDYNGDGIVESIKNELTNTESSGFKPIGGNTEKAFKGVFDGNCYELKNIYINSSYGSLFTNVENGEILNLKLTNASITNQSCGAGFAYYLTNSKMYNCGIDGALLSSTNSPTAGLAYTTNNSEIVSCYNNADITGVCTSGISCYTYNSLIEKCYNTGDLTSVGPAGGVGYTLENCIIKDFYNTGDATSTSGGVSGIGSYMTKCTVVNSYNTGNITGKSTCGGIASNLTDSTIENCYNTGNITDTSAPAGGIAYNISNCTITNFYNTGDVSGASGAGGFSQSASNSTFTNCYNEGNIVSPNSSAGGLVTYLSNSSLTKCFNKGTVTAEQGSIAGGVAATISNSELHQCFNESAVSSGSAPAGGFAYSIDKSTITECYNLGNVTSGITGSTVGVAGFAVNASNSKINNCYNKGNISTTLYTAGLIGYDKNNTIENCYNEGQILAASCAGGITYESTNSTLKNIINKGTIASSGPSGGIVYTARNCNIEKCANIAEIRTNAPAGGVVYTLNDSTLIKSYNTAEVYGPSCAGGVVEYASNSLIQDCYNTGNVISTVPAGGVVYSMSSTTVNNCYNTGDVSGNYGVGGVVGYGGTGCTINNCYNIGTVVAGTSSTGNPIGGVIYSPSGTTIKDTYYLSTSAPTGIYNQTDVSGVTDSKALMQMNARTFTKLLNDNKEQILTRIPLSNWKHNTSGCPVLDYTIDLDSFVIDVDDILNDASQKIENNSSNNDESNNINNQPITKPSYEIVDSDLTITNSKTAKVIVHHYLEGTGPEFENEPTVLAVDEIIIGKENYDYITAPNLDIEGYTLIKDVNGEYIIPENATGKFTLEDQHIYYYYNVKPLELIVHHYLEGTEDTLADDEQYFYNENDHYKTNPSQDVLKSYDLVEVVGDEEKDITQNEVVTYYYKKKEYKVTTKVVIPEAEAEAGRTEKGGTILGEGEDPYEVVKHGENSKNDIIATPDEGYKLGSITVNGKVVPFTIKDGKIQIEKFENITEDKEVIVTFIPTNGKVITHHYVQGTTEKLHEDIINIDKIGAVVPTGPIDIKDYKLVDSAGNKDENGNVVIVKEINEGVEEIIYYYQRAYIITTDVIEHKEKYKDGTEKTGIKGGNITNEDVVIHEQVIKYNDSTKVIEMKPDEEYEVIEVRVNGQVVAFEKAGSGNQSGNINQDGVEMSTTLELDKDGNLVIPEGFFTNVQKDIHVEVQYRRKSKVIVKYLENDTEKVLAEDTEIVGYEGKEFETAVKIIPGYTLVMEVVSDDDQDGNSDENQEETIKITDENYNPTEPNGTMFSDDITVIYWYEKIDANVIERHIEINAKGEETELEFVVHNDEAASTVETLRKEYEGYVSTNAPEETVNKHTNVTFVDKEENKSIVTVDNTKVKEVWYYYIKQYNITTEVKPHKQTIDGVEKEVEGGTISKQFKIDENGKEVEDIYEVVDNRADSKKEIKMVPEDGYRIKSVTINDEEIFIDNMVAEDKSLVLPAAYFKDVQKDYHIVVEYERIPAKVIVQYIDEFTKESIRLDKVIDGFVHDEYNETRPEIDSYIAVNPEPENSQGKMVEGVITIVYYYGKQYRITTDVIEHLEDKNNLVDVIVDKTDDTVNGDNGSNGDESGDNSVDSEGSADSDGSGESEGSGNETNPDSSNDSKEDENDTVVPEGKILVKGGSIQGEDEKPYEAVSRGENNIKEILIKPDEGYRIKSLKIKDGETEYILSVPDLLTEENTIILPKEYFKNMQSDKHIMVEFEPIPAKVVVNYLDIATKESEKQEKVSISEEGNGFVNNEYKTYAKDIAYYELVKEEIPANSTGKLTEKETVVNYWYRKLLFNMKLTKELSSVQVNGQERLEQDKKFVKIDIANADVNNTNILVKYKIVVTNTEKVEGIAKIVEDIPDGFKYIAENANGSQWIEVDGKLELTTKTLKPGETVEYEITLEWDKEQKSVGRLINTATITETQNIPGYEETTKEDNEDMAVVEIKINKTVSDVIGGIISDVKTGDVVIVSIMTLVIAGAVLVITIKKRK